MLPDNESSHPRPILDGDAFALAEYSALRDEILKRIDLQQQILSITFVAASLMLSLGAQYVGRPIILLLYPILAWFLAAGWVQHNLRVQRASPYLQEEIETRVKGGGWERHRVSQTQHSKYSASAAFARGAFVVTQLTAVLLAVPRCTFTMDEIILLILSVLSILVTFRMIRTLPRM